MKREPGFAAVCLTLFAILLIPLFLKETTDGQRLTEHHGVEPNRSAAPAESAAPRMIRAKVTAYCLCKICCGKWANLPDRKTSIGDDARIYDGVAADSKLLPYRTLLDIPGIGIKEVDDTGGGMRQSAKQGIYHIDVRMPSHEAARRWGVKWLNVAVFNNKPR